MAAPICIPTYSSQGFPFLQFLTNIFDLCMIAILTGVKWYVIVFFVLLAFIYSEFTQHKLMFFMGYIFLLHNLFFWSRNNLFFFSRIISLWQGELVYGLVYRRSVQVCFVHMDVLNLNLKFSITFCIFKHVQQKFNTQFEPPVLFPPHCLTWAHLPNLPL